ncbi:hypothetical protein D3C80_1942140 [compost metagenome]
MAQPGLATAKRWLVSLASTRTSARRDITARRVSSMPGRRMTLAVFTAAEMALSWAVPDMTAKVTPSLS